MSYITELKPGTGGRPPVSFKPGSGSGSPFKPRGGGDNWKKSVTTS